MPHRRLYLQAKGWWVITNRSNPGLTLFRDAEDYSSMVSCLAEGAERFHLRVSGYVLLPDHFHVLLHTGEGVLPRFMHWMNLAYGHRHRARHGFRGHLFSGNYEARTLFDDTETLLHASFHLHLHPHRHQRGIHGPALPWLPPSPHVNAELALHSIIAHGWNSLPDWLTPAHCRSWIHPAVSGLSYRERLIQILRAGLPEGIASLPGPPISLPPLPEEQIPKDPADALREVIRQVEREQGLAWEEFRNEHGHPGRDLVLCRAAREGLNTATLGRLLHMSPAAVSKALQRCRGKCPEPSEPGGRRTPPQTSTEGNPFYKL